MANKIDLIKTVLELTQEYPELIDIIKDHGFSGITRKPVLYPVEKNMTISHETDLVHLQRRRRTASAEHPRGTPARIPRLSAPKRCSARQRIFL